MVYCPPRPAQTTVPDPDPWPGPDDPFLDPEPSQAGPRPGGSGGGTATAPPAPVTAPSPPRRKRNRIRVILGTGLTAALALGLAGSSASQPAYGPAASPRPHPARGLDRGLGGPKDVITQARERQQRRRRRLAQAGADTAATTGGLTAAGGPPPWHRHRHEGPPSGQVPLAWGRAQPLTGPVTRGWLMAQIFAMSCPRAGSCGIGGIYTDSSDISRTFAAGQQAAGPWGSVQRISRTGASVNGGLAGMTAISCTSPGNCQGGGTGGGTGTDTGRAFLASEVNGTWVRARPVPGLATPAYAYSGVLALSCPSAGNCAAGGTHGSGIAGLLRAFVVDEVNGRWLPAEPVPGLAALNTGRDASVEAVSCASAGNCTAGGTYSIFAGTPWRLRLFVASETHGVWGQAEQIPGTAALTTGAPAATMVNSVSCASAGNCTVTGTYGVDARAGSAKGFIASQVNGRWMPAETIPGTPLLNGRGVSVSCPAAGNCAVGGPTLDGGATPQPFLIAQAGGTWGRAQPVPGLAALNKARAAAIYMLSCASAGNCAAVGYYTNSSHISEAFVVTQVHGTWGTAQPVPGLPALGATQDQLDYVSCPPPAGPCTAAGTYTNSHGHEQVFTVTQQ